MDASTFDIYYLMNDMPIKISCEYMKLTILRIIHYMSLHKIAKLNILKL
jgi:hypothetical protein